MYWRFLADLWHSSRRQPSLLLSGLFLVVLSSESVANLYPSLLGTGWQNSLILGMFQQSQFWSRLKDAWVNHPLAAAGLAAFLIAAIVVLYSLFVLAQTIIRTWVFNEPRQVFSARFAVILRLNIIFSVLLAAYFVGARLLLGFVSTTPWAFYTVLAALVLFFFILYTCRRLAVAHVAEGVTASEAFSQGINYFRRSWAVVLKTFVVFFILTVIALATVKAVSLVIGAPAVRIMALFTSTGWKSAVHTTAVLSSALTTLYMLWVMSKLSSLEWLAWFSLPSRFPQATHKSIL